MHLFANIRLSLQAPVLVLLYPSTAPLPQNTLQNHAPTWRKKHHFFALFLHISFIPQALRTMPLHTSHARKNAKNSATKNFSYGNSKSLKRYTNATTWLGTFEY